MYAIDRDKFTAWVGQQPPTKQFDYFDIEDCAAAQFLKTEFPNAERVTAHYVEGVMIEIDDALEMVIARGEEPDNFGALHKRLQEM